MANVLNRTTKQYLASVSTPKFPEADWVWFNTVVKVASADALIAAGIPVEYWKINADDTVTEMTAAEKAVIDDASTNLNASKEARYAEITERSEELAADQGFTYATKTFALDAEAREKWTGLGVAHALGILTFPQVVGTKDHDQYSIADAADFVAFFGAGLAAYKAVKEPGSDLKKSVFDAATKAVVDAVVDSR